MAVVYLAVGSNLGNREANIQKGIELLGEKKDIFVKAASKLIETRAEGGPADQNDYLNGALEIDTDLMPTDLLMRLKGIERRLGRPKNEERNLPRTLDFDILFYDDVVIVSGKNLTIPHPRMAERLFVLRPLAEIAPDVTHPRTGKTVKTLLEEASHAGHPHSSGS